MALLCKLTGHRPSATSTFNEGLYFAQCRRCHADLFRQKGGEWLSLPPGLRIKWAKEGQHSVPPWIAADMARRRR